MDTSPELVPVAQQLVTGLARMGTWLRTRAWRDMGPHGLNPTQAQVLTVINTRGGALRLAEIADWLGVTPATASDTVTMLDEKGLVTKNRDPRDGRAIAVALTACGQEEARRGAAWPEGVIAAAMEGLTPAEQNALMKAVIKIIRRLQERGEISVARMCLSCRYFGPNAHPSDPDRPHHCHLVHAPFGDRHLRVECPEHEAADPGIPSS